MQPVAKPRPADRRARFRIRTGGLAVRSLLAETMTTLAGWGYPPQGRGRVELVLAEVLNNVVEHGYGNRAGRPVALALRLTGAGLTCIVTDRGRPYPDDRLPAGGPALLSGTRDSLPEGGFGWHLIREMTADLQYRRTHGCNELALHFQVV